MEGTASLGEDGRLKAWRARPERRVRGSFQRLEDLERRAVGAAQELKLTLKAIGPRILAHAAQLRDRRQGIIESARAQVEHRQLRGYAEQGRIFRAGLAQHLNRLVDAAEHQQRLGDVEIRREVV